MQHCFFFICYHIARAYKCCSLYIIWYSEKLKTSKFAIQFPTYPRVSDMPLYSISVVAALYLETFLYCLFYHIIRMVYKINQSNTVCWTSGYQISARIQRLVCPAYLTVPQMRLLHCTKWTIHSRQYLPFSLAFAWTFFLLKSRVSLYFSPWIQLGV